MHLESDEQYMDLALAEAQKAESAGEVPVGAVAVADGAVVGRGFNQPISANDPTAHAEILALRDAAKNIGNYRLAAVTMYCTVEPCMMCAGAMIHARIHRVVFACRDFSAGAGGSVCNLLSGYPRNHRVLIDEGMMQQECSLLLQEFFKARRGRSGG